MSHTRVTVSVTKRGERESERVSRERGEKQRIFYVRMEERMKSCTLKEGTHMYGFNSHLLPFCAVSLGGVL